MELPMTLLRNRREGAWLGVLLLALSLLFAGAAHAAAAAPAADTGYLAIAADRGFQGNEEIRDAFDAFAGGRNAELVFATDQRTRATLDAALARLAERGAKNVVVLPVFLSAADPKFVQAKAMLAASALPVAIAIARPFGESYFAVEALAEQLRAIHHPQQANVVITGFGADGPASRRSLEADWQRIAERAADGFGFAGTHVVVWADGRGPEREARRAESRKALADAAQGKRAVVVPFHFGRRLDGMMSFDAELKQSLPPGAELLTPAAGPETWLAGWMTREANRRAALAPRDVGVIVLAHGSDYHWNETMRQAVQPLQARHPVEVVFSMADQPLIERAVRRLEKRGARAAVIVRVFGLESSFRSDVERMIGADVEGAAAPGARPAAGEGHGHGAHHGHQGHDEAADAPPPRIRSALALATAGGVEAHPLFAAALLERARSLSSDPRKETVILVAHGAGDDTRNQQWVDILGRIAAQMKAGGTPFRAIRHATWREDWPDQRAPWIKAVRQMVEEARKDGGRALVIPARTNGTGPERAFLEGLTFELGEGFAPHPLFLRWIEQQVEAGSAALRAAR
jgi:sirohydrochlorin ferrochelatase